MTGKRRWRDFPDRLRSELRGISEITGLGGLALGVGGVSFASGPIAVGFVSGGAVIALGTLLYAGYKAVPPLLLAPSDLLGRAVTIDELRLLSEKIPIFAIIGPELAGKTTLRSRLSLRNDQPERTTSITAQIISLQTSPEMYIAVLDGDGSDYTHQFELIEHCDNLIVILDHSPSNVETVIDDARLKRHSEFLQQALNSIRAYKKNKLSNIMFLWNKKDNWSKENNKNLSEFRKFIVATVDLWKGKDLCSKINSIEHSNNSQENVARIMEAITEISRPAAEVRR